ncbi:Asp23/Gls24 family envelope stress response protein [Rathayibacter toxicus]|uniref:Asp23/Gls24 family envelope stress response protein n=1 Tax=Rathayibacter toxicus TaxID=145458 RepID=A0A2S5YA81_9MICO|nr:Asp23/Gls24 family envelope stress response protein [Rathayibacter toxicus]ALS57265.1 hypothetical protein APU90_05340 [Rathayibacter toxicus]PPG24860.1 Asp23/Gls24 family envelope stress response protein [Rathayibacter toxicus]PPG48315.1 Asp23/Gls24 family envelope stress response protein [Rathayibacter toxicus]PPH25611.1 Asp23/Gls24 family envelope stress response protein [Rathayibacter toxicus]PPH59311.1 Asp23/Gls24 family envelope stress response protein [Rathayibacter toxicus]
MSDSFTSDTRDRSGDASAEYRVALAAAAAASGVPGVHRLGGPAARSLDQAARAVLGVSTVPGVTVVTNAGVTTIDLDVVLEYPHPVTAVTEHIREAVRALVECAAAIVNVRVTGVHGPFDPDETPQQEHHES